MNVPQNWIPWKLQIENNLVLCRWLFIANKRFTEPFFDETVGKCLSYAPNSTRFKSVCSLDALIDVAEKTDAIAPTALIFHVSRCGSTLLSQLLCTDTNNIVLSEMPLLDELLRLPYKTDSISKINREKALLAVIKLLGQKRIGQEQRLFIKLDSWHICFYETFRKLFPDTPFVFLYRSPDEVIQSHQKLRGMQAAPGIIEPEIFGLTTEDAQSLALDEYLAKVLECYFEKIIAVVEQDKNTITLNYKEGAKAMIQQLAALTGYPLNDALITAMNERSQYHSKYGDQTFSGEDESPSTFTHQQKAMELYHKLEEKRSLKLIP